MEYTMIPRREAGGDYGFYTAPDAPSGNRTWLSVDVLGFTTGTSPGLVVWQRDHAPHKDAVSLPGAVVDARRVEGLADTAVRALVTRGNAAEHGVPLVIGAVSDPGRDERGHTISQVMTTWVRDSPELTVMRDADVLDGMPFQHGKMVRDYATVLLSRLLTDVYTARAVLPEDGFTSAEVVALVELLHELAGVPAPSTEALRKKVQRCELFIATEKTRDSGRTRPYRVLRVRD